MTRGQQARRLRAALTSAAVAWGLLLLLAPRWSSPAAGAIAGDGLRTVAAVARVFGAQVCHQRPERSIHLAGRPMPVCGRCSGLYLSGAVALLAAGVRRPRRLEAPVSRAWIPSWLDRLTSAAAARAGLDARAGWLAVAAMPTLGTWALEVAGLWNPGTSLRALAALPLGLTAGWLIGRALQE